MQVPMLDLKAQYGSIKSEIINAVHEVLEAQSFILGPKVIELEERIAAYSGAKYAVGVSSGSDALLISLMALDIRPGDEVITTSFTFFSTAGVISRMNAVPVFVDIDPNTFNIDPKKIREAVSEKTKAIIPVHLFGQCADMDSILEIAKEHRLPVVEDAAQSIGAQYKGQKAGAMGNLGIFSFYPSKNLGGYGDGGMVLTNDDKLYDLLRILRVHGAEPKYYHKKIGGNFRLDALQAAILLVKLGYLDEWSKKRRENADDYHLKFSSSQLDREGKIGLPQALYRHSGDDNYHIYNQFTLRTEKRDDLKVFLKENGIGSDIYYPRPLHFQECFADRGYKKGDLPIAEKASREVLSIPVYPELTPDQKDYVVERITRFYRP